MNSDQSRTVALRTALRQLNETVAQYLRAIRNYDRRRDELFGPIAASGDSGPIDYSLLAPLIQQTVDELRRAEFTGEAGHLENVVARISAGDEAPILEELEAWLSGVMHIDESERQESSQPGTIIRDASDWRCDAASLVHRLKLRFDAKSKIKRMLSKWWQEHSETTSRLFPPCKRDLSLVEKYALLVVIHDEFCECKSEMIPLPDLKNDPAAKAITRRLRDETKIVVPGDFEKAIQGLRWGVRNKMPVTDLLFIEDIVRDVEKDLQRDCEKRGKEVRTSVFDEPQSAPQTVTGSVHVANFPQTKIEVHNLTDVATESEPPPDGVDATAFVPAKDVWPERHDTYREFKRRLDRIPETEIRRRKPSPQRLEIHAGDWKRYWAEQDRKTSEALDEESMQEFLANAEAMKADIKQKNLRK